MSPVLVNLFVLALEAAALVALPAIASVAAVGVIVGLAQSLTGVSDQNLAFGPKIAVIALLALLGGAPAFALLELLARQAIHALPYVAP